jgi:hypothetical protein
MGELLRARVIERINILGISAFEAAKRAGRQRNYIHDLVIGKKDTFHDGAFAGIAGALGCSENFLRGIPEKETQLDSGGDADGHFVAGSCAIDVWRVKQHRPEGIARVTLDPRLPADAQSIYQVDDNHAVGAGVARSAYVCVADMAFLSSSGREVTDGDIILVRRKDPDGRSEITLRTLGCSIAGLRLTVMEADEGNRFDIAITPDVELLGVVVRSELVFT